MTDTLGPTRPASPGGGAAGRPAGGEQPAGRVRDWFPTRQLVHLLYLGNLIWQPAFNPTSSWVSWSVVLVTWVLAVPLFIASHHPAHVVRRRALIGTAVLAVAVTAVNVGGSVLFVYAGAMAVYDEGRRALRWLVGLTAVQLVLVGISFVPWPYRLFGAIPGLVFIWVIGMQTMADAEREREAHRLRVENVRIEQLSAASERERIARDMHDLLGHSLTSLVVRAQLVQSLVGTDPDAAASEAAHLEGSAREALGQLRAAVTGLGAQDLVEEVDEARRTLTAAGVDVDVALDPDADPGPLVERCLALAVREAATNVARHARAGRCTIALTRIDDRYVLEVADDGIGSASAAEGNGLRGMRERIVAVGGDVRRVGEPGTVLTVTVPA